MEQKYKQLLELYDNAKCKDIEKKSEECKA